MPLLEATGANTATSWSSHAVLAALAEKVSKFAVVVIVLKRNFTIFTSRNQNKRPNRNRFHDDSCDEPNGSTGLLRHSLGEGLLSAADHRDYVAHDDRMRERESGS